MNDTAKKLREAADCVSGNATTLVQVISQVREKLDVEETDTFGGDLVAILIAIADELDELQAKANDANNLRQKLESAEKKAKCRKTHIWYLNDALRDKKDMLKQRGLAISRLTTDNSELRKKVPSERERQILAMWPRFEDDEYVWFGDAYIDGRGDANKVRDVRFDDKYVCLVGVEGFHTAFIIGERVKRHVQSVLDADGVEIKVGDTVWHRSLCTMGSMRKAMVTGFDENCLGGKLVTLKDEAGKTWYIDPKKITHVQPDSWEQLEEDAGKEPCDYFGVECDDDKGCGGCPHLREGRDCTIALQADLIRRAKALAGAEAGR